MIRTIIAAALIATPAIAQDAEDGSAGPKDTRDDTFLQSIDDMDVVGPDGENIGEIEEILVDQDGKPAAFLVEIDRGLFGLDDDDVAVPLEALEFNGSEYVSKMTEEQLENLRAWDE